MSSLINSDNENNIQTWTAPEVEENSEAGNYNGMLTAGQIEKIQKEAYKEGFELGKADGYKDGYKVGDEKVKSVIANFNSIADLLNEPLKDLDDSIVTQLVDLTTIIAGQVIRRELRIDPGQIIAVVRECIKSLPIVARKVDIYLHPDDAVLVREAFSIEENLEPSWKITEDPVLTRGGCRINAEKSKIDMTVEQQLNRVITSLLGSERKKNDD